MKCNIYLNQNMFDRLMVEGKVAIESNGILVTLVLDKQLMTDEFLSLNMLRCEERAKEWRKIFKELKTA